MQHAHINTSMRYVGTLLMAVAAMFVGAASLPAQHGGSGVLASVAPTNAQAFQGGWDRDHAWVKVTRGEIAQGLTYALCMRVTYNRFGSMCSHLATRAKQIIGSRHGVWAEVYWNRVNMGTW